MEIAQFLNGVITACGNHFLTDYLASLGDVARCVAFVNISLSLLRSAGVQLRDSSPALPGDWLPEPKPCSRLVSICLGQSKRSKTERLGVLVLLHAGVAVKNEQIDAKSHAHLNLVEKGGT